MGFPPPASPVLPPTATFLVARRFEAKVSLQQRPHDLQRGAGDLARRLFPVPVAEDDARRIKAESAARRGAEDGFEGLGRVQAGQGDLDVGLPAVLRVATPVIVGGYPEG